MSKHYRLKTDNIIIAALLLSTFILFIIITIIITKTNTQTTDDLINTAKCVDYHECEAIYNSNN